MSVMGHRGEREQQSGLGADLRCERGSALIEFPLVVGLVLIPFGVLVLSASTWVERQTAARDAAGEAARALVVSDPEQLSAEFVVREVEAGYGLPAQSLRASIPDGGFLPGESVTVEVSVEIPAMSLPVFGGVGSVDWTVEHTERFPDYGADR